MVTIDLRGDLAALVGTEVAVSEWILVDQPMVDAFADVTGDTQWIHVDPARAKAETPFGGTIAHGFLTLSLLSKFSQTAMRLDNRRMGINMGFNRVRFTSPVKTGSRVRGRFTLDKLDAIDGGWQFTWKVSVEIEGSDKPACVAEWLARGLL